MHAKLYISEYGAIICSANALYNGLLAKNRIEDGMLIKPGTKIFKDIEGIFERRYNDAIQIDGYALEAAPTCAFTPPNNLTLVEYLRKYPNLFNDVRFVISIEKVESSVSNAADAIFDQEYPEIVRREKFDYFSNWEMNEDLWPLHFFNSSR